VRPALQIAVVGGAGDQCLREALPTGGAALRLLQSVKS
jgi:hypothetical protein